MRLVAALTAAALLATAGTAAAAPPEHDAVQRTIDELTKSGGALGIQVLVDGRDTLRSGFAERGSRTPVPHNGTFRIGSVTKPFVSTVVLQLAGEGRLDLDVPVVRYLPGLVDARITVRQLLQHTSGLYDHAEALPLDPAGFHAIRFKTWTQQELVDIATSRPLLFEPGTGQSYSNTGYVVLGMLIEKLTGKPYQHAVEQRILKPLRLKDTVLPRTTVDIPGRHAHGYFPDAAGNIIDVTRLNPSWGGAAGEMISTTRDLDAFLAALLAGKLLKPAQQRELTATTAVSPGYGLGLSVVKLPCGNTIYGHDGTIHGFASLMLGSPDGKRFELSVTDNGSNAEPGDAYRELMNQHFC
ncbi:serine hydrolase domain-containing protein [Lentzea sp. CA-135723]|uniref:serine hydrolase domain-containing protein n=1 Tax=Lentzea sp. CA-135723 TaxID=3239950 RepID=UPI003D94E15A